VGDATVTEGDGGKQLVFVPFTLSRPATVDISFLVVTSCGTAGSDDYRGRSFSVTMKAGQRIKLVTIALYPDQVPELLEDFDITVTSLSGAYEPVDTVGSAVLADDDSPSTSPTSRVSVSSSGEESVFATTVCQGGTSVSANAVSADGRYVAFDSTALNLVDDDTNGVIDVFLRDTASGTTERVSLGTGGTEGNDDSSSGRISGDGRYVAFMSRATNLVADDTNGWSDAFVRDRATGITNRLGDVETWHRGSSFPDVASDGSAVYFTGPPDIAPPGSACAEVVSTSVYRMALPSGPTECAVADAARPSVSSDGRYVAFIRTFDWAGTDYDQFVFLKDTATGAVQEVSVSSDEVRITGWGVYSDVPQVSGNGRYVAFVAEACNLGAVCPYARGTMQVYRRDTVAGVTEVVSVDENGAPGLQRSLKPSIDESGHLIAFVTGAALLSNHDSGENHMFVRDMANGINYAVDETESGALPNAGVYNPRVGAAISSDGSTAIFTSEASDIIDDDTNTAPDVFRVDLGL
jgi:Tol biopolymer transport system component